MYQVSGSWQLFRAVCMHGDFEVVRFIIARTFEEALTASGGNGPLCVIKQVTGLDPNCDLYMPSEMLDD
jgi:hypothetical protein